MGDGLFWVFGSACAMFAALKLIVGVWCVIELHRKWRSVPELWSIDWLDIVFRLEREFGVAFSATDFKNWSAEARAGLTAGQLWEQVAAKLSGDEISVPVDGWERVVGTLSEALNVEPACVTPESHLYGDLGMVYGLE